MALKKRSFFSFRLNKIGKIKIEDKKENIHNKKLCDKETNNILKLDGETMRNLWFAAVRESDLELIQLLLQVDLSLLYIKDKRGYTALHFAIEGDSEELLLLLIQYIQSNVLIKEQKKIFKKGNQPNYSKQQNLQQNYFVEQNQNYDQEQKGYFQQKLKNQQNNFSTSQQNNNKNIYCKQNKQQQWLEENSKLIKNQFSELNNCPFCNLNNPFYNQQPQMHSDQQLEQQAKQNKNSNYLQEQNNAKIETNNNIYNKTNLEQSYQFCSLEEIYNLKKNQNHVLNKHIKKEIITSEKNKNENNNTTNTITNTQPSYCQNETTGGENNSFITSTAFSTSSNTDNNNEITEKNKNDNHKLNSGCLKCYSENSLPSCFCHIYHLYDPQIIMQQVQQLNQLQQLKYQNMNMKNIFCQSHVSQKQQEKQQLHFNYSDETLYSMKKKNILNDQHQNSQNNFCLKCKQQVSNFPYFENQKMQQIKQFQQLDSQNKNIHQHQFQKEQQKFQQLIKKGSHETCLSQKSSLQDNINECFCDCLVTKQNKK